MGSGSGRNDSSDAKPAKLTKARITAHSAVPVLTKFRQTRRRRVNARAAHQGTNTPRWKTSQKVQYTTLYY